MATISLRAYYSEIEGMIERGRTKDAIIHCRQILKVYPKSIDTYRLLGKAYLEAQRFTEGADVLQRVLSAVPDDFVSQIGLSIIREDEGNLDAALWHMERAFEAQPSNKAVQDELRRLYGRRDGVQPTKIRLTRGALVRMYARGDLYQQAIAEARMALVEQPDRVDIELILARMYYLSSQKISATEICSRILAKLPFCYEANKILSEILPGTARQDEIEIYKRRLFDLDPYLEFTPPGALSSAEAPEESIMVEALELDEARLAAEHPDLAGEEEERLPDWLAALETKEGPADELTQIMDKGLKVSGFAESLVNPSQTAEPVPNNEEQIPDWMKEAGWQPAEEGQEETETIPEEVAEEIASEAEIPEWLQSIAPTEETPGIFGSVESQEDQDDTAWLESILEGEVPGDLALEEIEPEAVVEEEPGTGHVPEPETASATIEGVHSLEDLSEEFQPMESATEQVDLENVADLLSAEGTKENVPEWLADMAEMETEPEQEKPIQEIPPDNEWLKSLARESEILAEAEQSEADEIQPTEFQPVQSEEAEIESAEEFKIDTDWLNRLPVDEETSPEAETELEEGLEPFESELEQPEEIEKTEAEDIKIDTDWLKRISPEEEVTAEAISSEGEGIQPPEVEPEIPFTEKESAQEFKITTDWLKSLPEDKEGEQLSQVAGPAEEEGEPEKFKVEQKAEVDEFAADADFLKRLAQEEELEEGVEEEQADTETVLPEVEKESIDEFAADVDWLKRLSIDEEAPAEVEPESTFEEPTVEEPALEPSLEAFEEHEVQEEAEFEGISLEETPPTEPKTAEEFLSEIEQALPPEKEATQPARISAPPEGGIPIEEFIAQLEAAEEIPAESVEISTETTGAEQDLPSEEIELTAAQLEEILPEVVADNNFDHAADSGIPEWLKESLEIEEMEPQTGVAEEAPSLEGIPGIFPEKTPEELALEEILAAPEEIQPEEAAPAEAVEEVLEWKEVEAVESVGEAAEIETLGEVEEISEELPEAVSSEALDAAYAEAAKLEAEEDRELLGWLAEDLEEIEQELAEEAEFAPPVSEESEWVKEETLIDSEETSEPVAVEATPEEAAEEIEQEEVPDWLMALADEKEPQPEAVEQKEETIPDWLKDLEEETEFEERPAEETIQTQMEEPGLEEALEVQEEPHEMEAAQVLQEEPLEMDAAQVLPEEPHEMEAAQVLREEPLETEEVPETVSVEETSPVHVAEQPVQRIPIATEGSDLYNAQAAMNAHDLEAALLYYNRLIEQGGALEDIIHDLREALDHYPVDISIWQALGDAYMRSNQLQNALDAYTKAEELMR